MRDVQGRSESMGREGQSQRDAFVVDADRVLGTSEHQALRNAEIHGTLTNIRIGRREAQS